MFVNVSPTAPSASETVCSLRFANQVRYILPSAFTGVFTIFHLIIVEIIQLWPERVFTFELHIIVQPWLIFPASVGTVWCNYREFHW